MCQIMRFSFYCMNRSIKADASIRKTPMLVIHNFIARSAIIQISYVPTSHENLLRNSIHYDKNMRFIKSPMRRFVSK